MDTLQIDVKGWPEQLVETLQNYANQVSTKLKANGEASKLAARELPRWPGVAAVPPESLRREALYREDQE